jgi:hypothetical protein
MKQVDIETRQCNRLMLLYLVYDKSLTEDVPIKDLAFAKGLKNGKFQEAYAYMLNEGLLKRGPLSNDCCHVTHEGLKLIEWCIVNTNKKAENWPFPPLNELSISID